MKSQFISTLLLGCSLLLTACSKELSLLDSQTQGGGPGGNTMEGILGTYDFAGLELNMKSSTIYDFFGEESKTITITNYQTINNKGTVIIKEKELEAKSVSYDIETFVRIESYLNGVFEDSASMPFVYAQPVINTTGPYRADKDSMYVKSFLTSPLLSDTLLISNEKGMKMKWSGDTLILSSPINVSYRTQYQGMNIFISNAGYQRNKLIRRP